MVLQEVLLGQEWTATFVSQHLYWLQSGDMLVPWLSTSWDWPKQGMLLSNTPLKDLTKRVTKKPKKLPHHCCIELLYSAYYFLMNHAPGSPHTGAHANAEDNRRACCYWANWERRSIFPGRIAGREVSFPPSVFRAQPALTTRLLSQNWTSWKYEALLHCW